MIQAKMSRLARVKPSWLPLLARNTGRSGSILSTRVREPEKSISSPTGNPLRLRLTAMMKWQKCRL